MFTGIIEELGRIASVDTHEAGSRIVISANLVTSDIANGDSISVNGVCLTVTEARPSGEASFYLSSETVNRSNLRGASVGSRVNLERAVQASTRLSGHLVQGHVDGLATLVDCNSIEGSFQLNFEIPARLTKYCIEKGSITLNGVSLTINSLVKNSDGQDERIRHMIIPHTWTHTNLCDLKARDQVNVEVDLIAKYVEKLCQPSPER